LDLIEKSRRFKLALVTGTPLGNVDNAEELYIEGAPNLYVQDYNADPLFNPDGDGYYYGMSGTSSYPVYGLACVDSVTFQQGITANDIRCDTIRCDTVGNKGMIQRRDYVQFTFNLKTLMPLSMYAQIANLDTALVSAPYEKVGIGGFNNTKYFMVYAPKVYDETNGYWLLFHLHKAQFVEPGDLTFNYGEPWIQQFSVRGFADDTKPTTQRFGTIIRVDPNAIT